MRRFFNDFFEDDFFDSFFRRPMQHRLLGSGSINELQEFRGAAADIWEEKGEIKARIDLPGIDKKDIELKVTDNLIEVKAEKKTEQKQEGKDFFRQERSFAGFYKAFALPHKIDAQKVQAEYKNGVLEISAPKTEKETKKIEVK